MTVVIRRLPNEPILVATFDLPFSGEDVDQANQATAAFVEEIGQTVFRIENVVGELSLHEIMEGLYHAAHTGALGSARDPRVRFLLVGRGTLMELTAESFAQQQYAARKVPLFSTLEEALAHARVQLQHLSPRTGTSPLTLSD